MAGGGQQQQRFGNILANALTNAYNDGRPIQACITGGKGRSRDESMLAIGVGGALGLCHASVL